MLALLFFRSPLSPPHSSLPSCPFSMARDCRLQLEELQGSQKDQVLQAERALEEFRAQSEASTSTMLSQMRREVRTYIRTYCMFTCIRAFSAVGVGVGG